MRSASMVIGAALVLSTLSPVMVRADFTNGSYETFATSGTGISAGFGNYNYIYRGGAVGLTGWTVTGNSIDIVGTHFWSPPTGGGSWSIDLVGSENTVPPGTPQLGGVSQALTGLTVGQKYRVTFWHSVNPENDTYNDQNKPKILDVAVLDNANNGIALAATGGGVSQGNNHVQYTLTNGTRTTANMQWLLDSVDFFAPTSDVTVQFSAVANVNPSLTPNLCGPVIDLVSFAEAPEPASVGILAVGAALLCMHRRRARH